MILVSDRSSHCYRKCKSIAVSEAGNGDWKLAHSVSGKGRSNHCKIS